MKKDLILFGPPGAGKGTQGALLADHFGMLRLSTGDVLRDAVRRGTTMGSEAQRYMNAGELVPDEVILGIVRDYLNGEAVNAGVICDGFPRTLPQARKLNHLLGELNRPLFGVIVLRVDDEMLIKRLSGRRSCGACGAVYNVYFEPPRAENVCDSCSGPLTLRPDDEAATVRRRLEVYNEQTAPLVEYYEGASVPIHHVNGDQAVDAVQRDLITLIEK